jgi:hypothetical protein
MDTELDRCVMRKNKILPGFSSRSEVFSVVRVLALGGQVRKTSEAFPKISACIRWTIEVFPK